MTCAPIALLAAHGSRDHRFTDTVEAVVDALRTRLPHIDIRVGYLDVQTPSLAQALSVAACADTTESVTIVPLLLSDAYHARIDIPQVVTTARVEHPGVQITVTPALTDTALSHVLIHRLHSVGIGPTDGVVVVAVGSSHQPADTAFIDRVTAVQQAFPDNRITYAFATRRSSIVAATQALQADGVTRIVVSPWFLSCGTLTDRVDNVLDESGCAWTTAEPVSTHPLLLDVLTERIINGLCRPTARDNRSRPPIKPQGNSG